MKVTVSGTLELQLEQEQQPPRFLWSVNSGGVITQNVTMLALPNDKKVVASITPIDSKGNPAQIDGLASWSSSNPQIASVTNISADSLSAEVIPGTLLGSCQINVQADADLGTGVTNITGVLDVSVVAGQAVGFTIETAPPVPV